MVDLDREQDIEELRRIAHAQQAQIRILLEAIEKQRYEIASLKGKKPDAQLTLKMLEALQAKAKLAEEALAKAEAARDAKAEKKPRAPRTSTGPTEQPNLPIVEQTFVLDDADRACPSCGGHLSAMKDQFDESRIIPTQSARSHGSVRCTSWTSRRRSTIARSRVACRHRRSSTSSRHGCGRMRTTRRCRSAKQRRTRSASGIG